MTKQKHPVNKRPVRRAIIRSVSRFAAVAAFLASALAGANLAAANTMKGKLLVLGSNVKRYPVGLALNLTEKIRLSTGDKLRLVRQNTSVVVIEGPKVAALENILTGSTRFSSVLNAMEKYLSAEGRQIGQGAFRNSALVVDGYKLSYGGSRSAPVSFCSTGKSLSVGVAEASDRGKLLAPNGAVIAEGPMKAGRQTLDYRGRLAKDGVYRVKLSKGGDLYLRVKIVGASELSRDAQRPGRLLKAGCAAQARADAAF